MVTEYGGVPVSGTKEGQYYLELDENEERLPRADRQQTAHQSQLRYRVRPCGVCLSGRRNGAERCVLYGETGADHGVGRAFRWRQSSPM